VTEFKLISIPYAKWADRHDMHKAFKVDDRDKWHLTTRIYERTSGYYSIVTACNRHYLSDENSVTLDTKDPDTFVCPEKLCPDCFTANPKNMALRALIRKQYKAAA
jgi:hypothetical protein